MQLECDPAQQINGVKLEKKYMKKTMRGITCTALILLCVIVVLQAKCPAGEYWYQPHPFDGHCTSCNRGYYCPGDNSEVQCSAGTYAPLFGMSSCQQCPSDTPLSSPTFAFCMPADTPKNIQTVNSYFAEQGQFTLQDNGHYVIELDFSMNAEQVILNFFNSSAASPPIALYASRKTGNPSVKNFEMSSLGKNVTLAFEKPSDGTRYVPYYFSTNIPAEYAPVQMTVLGSPLSIQVLDKTLHSEVVVKHTAYFSPYIFFEVPNIQQKSRITITVRMHAQKTDSLAIFASSDSTVTHPTASNYNMETWITQDSSKSVTTTLEVNDVPRGVFHFSVYAMTFSIDTSKVTFSTTVEISNN